MSGGDTYPDRRIAMISSNNCGRKLNGAAADARGLIVSLASVWRRETWCRDETESSPRRIKALALLTMNLEASLSSLFISFSVVLLRWSS